MNERRQKCITIEANKICIRVDNNMMKFLILIFIIVKRILLFDNAILLLLKHKTIDNINFLENTNYKYNINRYNDIAQSYNIYYIIIKSVYSIYHITIYFYDY